MRGALEVERWVEETSTPTAGVTVKRSVKRAKTRPERVENETIFMCCLLPTAGRGGGGIVDDCHMFWQFEWNGERGLLAVNVV